MKLRQILIMMTIYSYLPVEAMEKTKAAEKPLNFREKEMLFDRIVAITQGQLNEVQQALDALDVLLSKQHGLFPKLQVLKERFIQPELLIRTETAFRDDLLATSQLSKDHIALAPLAKLIEDIKQCDQTSDRVRDILNPLEKHYQDYYNAFFSPSVKRPQHLHPKALLTIESLGSEHPVSYRISQEMAYTLLSKDIYGFLKKKNKEGSHAVSFLKDPSGGIHFKGNTAVNGLAVGKEAALYWLSQILFGHGLSSSVLVLLNDVEKKEPAEKSATRANYSLAIVSGKTTDEYFNENPLSEGDFLLGTHQYVVQASDHVDGISLQEYIELVAKGSMSYEDIDKDSFSEQVLFSLLTNPSDGTPGNFMVRTTKKPYTIVAIDNDMALGPEMVFVSEHQKHSIEVKNVLYCLPLMDKPISTAAKKTILALDPLVVTVEWLAHLYKQEQSYNALTTTQYSNAKKGLIPYLSHENYAQSLLLPLMFSEAVLKNLQKKLSCIQEFLQNKPQATHKELFKELIPTVYDFYDALQKRHQDEGIIGIFRHICNSNYEQVFIEDVVKKPHRASSVIPKYSTKEENITQALLRILQFTDLKHVRQKGLFIQTILNHFSGIVDPSALHPSWYKEKLLFQLLKEHASHHVISFILTLGIDRETTNDQESTLLHVALECDHPIEVIQLFLTKSLINSQDVKKITPLDISMEKNNIVAFKLLIDAGASQCSTTIASKFFQKYLRNHGLQNSCLKLISRNQELAWQASFELMFPPTGDGPAVSTTHYLKRVLRTPIKDQVVENDGFKSYAQHGNHIVARAIGDQPFRQEIYFKIYPELPGVEESVGAFTRKLIGYGAPFTELIRLGDIPILLSQGIKGKPLIDIMRQNPTELKKLDERDLSGLIIAAMLINPEDGKPDNYLVEAHPTQQGTFRLVCVDNDHAFVPAVVKEKPDRGSKTVVQVKTVLYCLDQMKNPVHSEIRSLLLDLDIDHFLEQWLRTCKELHFSYAGLFTPQEQWSNFKEQDCFIGIPFKEGHIAHLYEKFILMKDILSAHPDISHIELLAKLEPRLAKRYKEFLYEEIDCFERFKRVDAPFYRQNSSGGHTTVTDSGMILQSMNIPIQETIAEQIERKEYSPLQALSELTSIREELKSKTFKSLCTNLGKLDAKSLHLSTSWSGLLQSINFKKLSPSEQMAVLKAVQQRKNLSQLYFAHCEVLTDDILQKMTLEHLKIIDLRGCPKISHASIEFLAQHAPLLTEMNLAGLGQLKNVGSRKKSLSLPSIVSLNLSGCQKLKKIYLEAPNLCYININNCSLMSKENFAITSPALKKFEFEGTLIDSLPKHSLLLYRDFKKPIPFNPYDEQTEADLLYQAISQNNVDVVRSLIMNSNDLLKVSTQPSVLANRKIAWCPDGKKLALAAMDTKEASITIWDVNHGKQLLKIPHESSITRLALSTDGSKLAFVDKDNTVFVYDTYRNKKISTMRYATDVKQLIWSPDDNKVAISNHDGTVQIKNLSSGKLKSLDAFGTIFDVCWSPDSSRLGIATVNSVYIINCETSKSVRILKLDAVNLRFIAWSPNGSKLAFATDRFLEVYDVHRNNTVFITLTLEEVVSINWSPDSSYLAIASAYNATYLYAIENVQALFSHHWASYEPDIYSGNFITWAGDGSHLITNTPEKTMIWDVQEHKLLSTIDAPSNREAWSSDGRHFVTLSSEKPPSQSILDWATAFAQADPAIFQTLFADTKFLKDSAGVTILLLSALQVRTTDLKRYAELIKVIAQRPVTELNLQDCMIPDTTFQEINVSILESINLNGCSQLSIDSIKFLAQKAPKLKRLHLKGWKQLESLGTEEHVLRFNSLESLELTECVNLRKIHLIAPQLTTMDTKHCPQLDTPTKSTRVQAAFGKNDAEYRSPRIQDSATPSLPQRGSSLLVDKEAAQDPLAIFHYAIKNNLIEHAILALDMMPNNVQLNALKECLPLHVYTLNHAAPIRALAWNKDSTKLATICTDHTATVWDVIKQNSLCTIAHKDEICSLCWSPDGNLLATGSKDSTAQVWDITNKRHPLTVYHLDSVNVVSWNAEGVKLATASNDGTCQIWDTRELKYLATLSYEHAIEKIAFNPVDSTLAIGDKEGAVEILGILDQDPLITPQREKICSLSWSPDGSKVAVSYIDSTIQIWEIVTRSILFTIIHTQRIQQVAWHPDNCHLAIGSVDGIVEVWNLSKQKLIAQKRLPAAVKDVTWAPDGSKIAILDTKGAAYLWVTDSYAVVSPLSSTDSIISLAWSPDSAWLATGLSDGSVKILEMRTPLDWALLRAINDSDLQMLKMLLTRPECKSIENMVSTRTINQFTHLLTGFDLEKKDPTRLSLLADAHKLLTSKPGAPSALSDGSLQLTLLLAQLSTIH